MSSLVVGAVLLAAAAHASWNALVKGRGGTDPLTSTFGLCAVWALLALPATLVVPWPEAAAVPYLATSVGVHLVYTVLLVLAYRSGDLSLVYPVARGTPPMLVAVAMVPLGERLSAPHGLGVVVLALGVFVLAPTKTGAASRRAMGWALGCALCTATYTIVDGTGTRLAGGAVSYVSWLTGVQGALFALGALALEGRPLLARTWERRGTALGAGILSAAGYGVALWAMTQAPIAAVAALREASVPMAALLGVWWLGEHLDARRGVALGLVVLGAVLLRLG
ncbi:MAG: DMT family transporter [Myxococcales bacterium]|nr:DMT family transporter [Myxococcales bacterium]